VEGLPGVRDRTPPKRMLSRRDVADMFGVSPETVGEWVRRGLLPSPLRIGRKLFWTPEAIAALLEGGR
jgi:predicted DNA-binding transcriptional regulator AlpA